MAGETASSVHVAVIGQYPQWVAALGGQLADDKLGPYCGNGG